MIGDEGASNPAVVADYACIPLDVPGAPVDIAELRAFVHRNCERCAVGDDGLVRLLIFFARKPVIDGALLLHTCDPRFEDEVGSGEFDWDPIFKRCFPELVDWFERLPFRLIHGVDLVTQMAAVRDHMDIFGFNNSYTYFARNRELEPIYYRAVLADDPISRGASFYVARGYEGPRDYVRLPPGRHLFAMSSSICYHGATFNAGHFKTTVAMYGELDNAAHLDLLQRSLDRYGDLAIRYEGAGPAEGPAAVLPYGGT